MIMLRKPHKPFKHTYIAIISSVAIVTKDGV